MSKRQAAEGGGLEQKLWWECCKQRGGEGVKAGSTGRAEMFYRRSLTGEDEGEREGM